MKKISSFLVFLSLVSCIGEDVSRSSASVEEEKPVNGIWVSQCDVDRNTKVLDSKVQYEFNLDGTVVVTNFTYDGHNSNCANVQDIQVDHYFYSMQGNSISLTYQKGFREMKSAKVVRFANIMSDCKLDNWVVNQPKEITKTVCAPYQVGKGGSAKYSFVGEQLKFDRFLLNKL